MLSSSQLQTLFNQFQSRYPMGCLCAELLTIHQGHYVVRALVQLAGTTLATAMAAAPDVETAEDQAKIRALEAIGLGTGTSSTFAQSVSSAFLPNLASDTSQPQKSSSTNPAQSRLHQPEEPSLPKAKLAPAQLGSEQEPKPLEKPISSQPLSSLSELDDPTPHRTEITTNTIDRFGSSELSALTTPATSSSSSSPSVPSIATTANTSFAPANFEDDFAASQEALAEPKTTVSTKASKSEKLSKRKSESFELPPVPAPSQNTSDRSEEIMKIGIEMKRLGWSTEQGREYLKRTYGKRSRQELDDAELLDFLNYLEGQPSPLQTPF